MDEYVEAIILSELIKSDNLDDLVKLNALRAKQMKKMHSNRQRVCSVQSKFKGIADRHTSVAIASLMRRGIW